MLHSSAAYWIYFTFCREWRNTVSSTDSNMEPLWIRSWQKLQTSAYFAVFLTVRVAMHNIWRCSKHITTVCAKRRTHGSPKKQYLHYVLYTIHIRDLLLFLIMLFHFGCIMGDLTLPTTTILSTACDVLQTTAGMAEWERPNQLTILAASSQSSHVL